MGWMEPSISSSSSALRLPAALFPLKRFQSEFLAPWSLAQSSFGILGAGEKMVLLVFATKTWSKE